MTVVVYIYCPVIPDDASVTKPVKTASRASLMVSVIDQVDIYLSDDETSFAGVPSEPSPPAAIGLSPLIGFTQHELP